MPAKRHIRSLLLLLFPLLMSAQTIRRMNFMLDSILNSNVPFGKTVLIFVKNDIVTTDTMRFERIRPKSDSISIITYANGHKRNVNNNELWGFINDFGQRKRIYFGEDYIIWHVSSPTVYRKSNLNTYSYYFSRSVSGEIVYMNPENIEAVNDPVTKAWLKDFYHDNSIQRKQAINNAVDVSIDITYAVFRIALFALEIYGKSR